MASVFRVRVKGGESLSYLNLISIAVAVIDAINLCDATIKRLRTFYKAISLLGSLFITLFNSHRLPLKTLTSNLPWRRQTNSQQQQAQNHPTTSFPAYQTVSLHMALASS